MGRPVIECWALCETCWQIADLITSLLQKKASVMLYPSGTPQKDTPYLYLVRFCFFYQEIIQIFVEVGAANDILKLSDLLVIKLR